MHSIRYASERGKGERSDRESKAEMYVITVVESFDIHGRHDSIFPQAVSGKADEL
jgi:hypothetical protein